MKKERVVQDDKDNSCELEMEGGGTKSGIHELIHRNACSPAGTKSKLMSPLALMIGRGKREGKQKEAMDSVDSEKREIERGGPASLTGVRGGGLSTNLGGSLK